MQDKVYLYQQVREDYKRLFPGQRAILALVYLYEQFGPAHAGGQVFTEDDLSEAMHRVAADEPAATDELGSRAAHQQWRHLQQYLLERDRDTHTYRFTVFGLALCQGLQKVFTEQVNPAQVAQTFVTLRRTLEDGDLLHWVQTVLPELRGVIQQHVETLAENLRIELRKLRRRTDHDDESLNLLVKRVSEALAELSQQAAELRAAFGQASELDTELERRWQSQGVSDAEIEAQLRAGVGQARDFLEHTHQRLRSLERRLSLVQPRIRDLFGNLRKLQFDRNSERLLDAFLHPDLPPGTWPAGLQPKSPGPPTQSYCLLGGRTERALPPQPVPARSRLPQPEAEAAFGRQTQAQWDVQQRITYWLNELTQAVEAHAAEGFPFIELAHRIGQTEGPQAFAILARLLAQLRRHVAPRRGWTLHPDPTAEEHLTIPAYTLTLWKLRIRPAPKS
ncbi:hypothetical protein GCM10028822_42760 [Hymenobacter terrigena]